ncbi:hypothetical protein HWV62_6779 [Athelia sp. TMB]|nr:hypothetical protein HWV62_6779 [Athelia sp. TMB]
MCSASIRGERYKCFDCPDYDMCAACFPLTAVHHPGHSFAVIRRPTDRIVRRAAAARHDTTCSSCRKTIDGVRYRCAECADCDLCEACEALPVPVHPPAHVLLKIRRPDAQIPPLHQDVSRSPSPAPTCSPQRSVEFSPSVVEDHGRCAELLDILEAQAGGADEPLVAPSPASAPSRCEYTPPLLVDKPLPPVRADTPPPPCGCAICLRGLRPPPGRLRKYASKMALLMHIA